MDTTRNEIDLTVILSSDPAAEKLRRALSNEIHPCTEVEAKLVRRVAYDLCGPRHVPEINTTPCFRDCDFWLSSPSNAAANRPGRQA